MELLGNFAAFFDGKVGDAAAGIELAGGDDGLSWAGVDTAGTSAACTFCGFICRKFQCREQFAEEDKGAEFFGDEERVFSEESEAGLLGVTFFEEGGGIDAGAVFCCWVEGSNISIELFEDGAEDFVIVATISVTGDVSVTRWCFWFFAIVVYGYNDNTFCPGEDVFWVRTKFSVFEVVHFSLAVFFDVGLQKLLPGEIWFGGSNANKINFQFV